MVEFAESFDRLLPNGTEAIAFERASIILFSPQLRCGRKRSRKRNHAIDSIKPGMLEMIDSE
jgi:hypothetical protein